MTHNDDLNLDPDAEAAWPRGDSLDELLGSDPTPVLSSDAVHAIHERLMREDNSALDGLLGLDEVTVPAGLAARIMERVESERRIAGGRPSTGGRLRILPPLVTAVALVAAAVLAIVLLRDVDPEGAAADRDPLVADGGGAFDDQPSDEFLAALPELEDLLFLSEELDPFEADALFLIDAEDALLLDLLEMGD